MNKDSKQPEFQEKKTIRRKPVWILMIVACGIFVTVLLSLRNFADRRALQRVQECVSQDAMSVCLHQARKLVDHNRENVRTGVIESLEVALLERVDGLTIREATESLKVLNKEYREIEALDRARALVKLRILESLPPSKDMADEAVTIAELLGGDAQVQLRVARIQARNAELDWKQLLGLLKRATTIDKSVIKSDIVTALAQLALQKFNLKDHHDLRSWLSDLFVGEEAIDVLKRLAVSESNPIARNNAFMMLSDLGQVNSDDVFTKHWLNLMQGSSETRFAFKNAVSFFRNMNEEERQESATKIDWGDLPPLSHIADEYSREAISTLFDVFPEQIESALRKVLKDKSKPRLRANSFYGLRERALLSDRDIRDYHQGNLQIDSYPLFTDWLIDSIDYFAERGHSGKQRLRDFASRIRQKRQASSDKEQQQIYEEIEIYTRTKVGKR